MQRKKLIEMDPSPSQPETEVCMNPWNGECENKDIAVYIVHEGRRLPIDPDV